MEITAEQAPQQEQKGEWSDKTLYQELLRRNGGSLTGPPETVQKFDKIYRQLASTAQEICTTYVDISKIYGRDPGETHLVMGGGRVKGKPLKTDSDIDFFFYVTNPKGGLDNIPFDKYPQNPSDALAEREVKQREFLKKIREICKRRDISNDFHVFGLGAPIPKQFDSNQQLVIATVKPPVLQG